MAHPTPLGAQPATTTATDIIMYTTQWCGDCRRAKRVFQSLGVAYTEIDIEQNPPAAAEVQRLNHGMRSVPTILFPDGSKLVEPANPELEAKLMPYAERSR